MATENIQNYIQVRYIETIKEKPVHIVFVDGTETNAVIAGSDNYCLLIYEIKDIEKEGEKKTVITHSSLIFKSAVSKIICKGAIQINLAEPVSESQSNKGNKHQQKKGQDQNGEHLLPTNKKSKPTSVSDAILREQPKKSLSRDTKMLGAKVDFEGLGKKEKEKEDEQGSGMELPDISIESRPDTEDYSDKEGQNQNMQSQQDEKNMQNPNAANSSTETGAQNLSEGTKDESSSGTSDALSDVPEFDFTPAKDSDSEPSSMENNKNEENGEGSSSFTSQDVVSNQNTGQEDKKETSNGASKTVSSSMGKKEDDDEYGGNPSLDEFLKMLQ